jgi:hypothetical protein
VFAVSVPTLEQALARMGKAVAGVQIGRERLALTKTAANRNIGGYFATVPT